MDEKEKAYYEQRQEVAYTHDLETQAKKDVQNNTRTEQMYNLAVDSKKALERGEYDHRIQSQQAIYEIEDTQQAFDRVMDSFIGAGGQSMKSVEAMKGIQSFMATTKRDFSQSMDIQEESFKRLNEDYMMKTMNIM